MATTPRDSVGFVELEIPRLPSIPSVVVRAGQTKTKRLLWWQTNVKYWRYNFFSYPSGGEHKKVDVSLRDVVRDFYSILRPIVCRDDFLFGCGLHFFFVGNSALRWGRCCVCYPDKGCERGSVPAGYGQLCWNYVWQQKKNSVWHCNSAKKYLWAIPKARLLYISFL